MEAATLRQLHPTPYATAPRAAGARPSAPALDEDWDWVYDDPDLAPFRGAATRGRKETPLSAWA